MSKASRAKHNVLRHVLALLHQSPDANVPGGILSELVEAGWYDPDSQAVTDEGLEVIDG